MSDIEDIEVVESFRKYRWPPFLSIIIALIFVILEVGSFFFNDNYIPFSGSIISFMVCSSVPILYYAVLLLDRSILGFDRTDGKGKRELGIYPCRRALKNLEITIIRTTVKSILKENGIEPAPKRGKGMDWSTFIKIHLGEIVAADFFTVEILKPFGLVRYY